MTESVSIEMTKGCEFCGVAITFKITAEMGADTSVRFPEHPVPSHTHCAQAAYIDRLSFGDDDG